MQEKKSADALERKLTDALSQLDNLLRSGPVGEDHLRYVQNFEGLLTEKGFTAKENGRSCITISIQDKFDHFNQLFEDHIRLNIEDDGDEEPPTNYYQSQGQRPKADCALRFSFEKSLKKMGGFGGKDMRPLEEMEEMEEDSGEIAGEQ